LGFFGGTTPGAHHGVSYSKERQRQRQLIRQSMGRTRKMVNERKGIGVAERTEAMTNNWKD